MTKKLKVLELFAGVGGFRVGLENADSNVFETKWANQWEPSRKTQDAFEVYDYHFPNSININENIEEIPNEVFEKMDADIIVGGFQLAKTILLLEARNMKWDLKVRKGFYFGKLSERLTISDPNILF